MSVETAMRDALYAELSGDGALNALINRVHDGPPAKASPPYVMLGEVTGGDWGTKTADGRELRVTVTVVDAGETSARVAGILPLVEAAVRRCVVPAGWQAGSVVLSRSRLVAARAGEWSALMEFRLRLLGA